MSHPQTAAATAAASSPATATAATTASAPSRPVSVSASPTFGDGDVFRRGRRGRRPRAHHRHCGPLHGRAILGAGEQGGFGRGAQEGRGKEAKGPQGQNLPSIQGKVGYISVLRSVQDKYVFGVLPFPRSRETKES